jgi:hypothetical protein
MSWKTGVFGKLTIRKEIAPDIFYCDCACGNELAVFRSLLVSRVQTNCGMCVQKHSRRPTLNGHTRSFLRSDGSRGRRTSREYNSYASMVSRCNVVSHHAYADYGGRGIRVCERWLPDGKGTGFKRFLEDMGPRPSGYTLDRKDPQGHYDPLNCRWADRDTQANNQRRQVYPDGAQPVRDYFEMEARLEAEMGPY